jgi:hypothetical protein
LQDWLFCILKKIGRCFFLYFFDGYELIGVEVLSDLELGLKLELKNKVENICIFEGYVKKINADNNGMEPIKLKTKKRNKF